MAHRRQHGGQDRALLSFDLEAGTAVVLLYVNKSREPETNFLYFIRFKAGISLESQAIVCVRISRI